MAYKTSPDYKAPTRDTKQRFIKEMNYFVKCRVCGIEYRSHSGWTWRIGLRLCVTHRRAWFNEQYKKYKSKPRFKLRKYQEWKRWVVANIESRRRLALESYHRRKNDPHNKVRSHHKKKTGS